MSETWKERRKRWKEEYDEECRTVDPASLGFTIFVVLTIVSLVFLNILAAIAFGIAAGVFRRIIRVRQEGEEKAKQETNPAESVEQCNTSREESVEQCNT
jgi:MFS superfamily sulfate permease-like transporter